jgi:hypothetical protein
VIELTSDELLSTTRAVRRRLGLVARGLIEECLALALQGRIVRSARHLADRMHEVPVLVVPCVRPRTDGPPVIEQAFRVA